MKLEIKNDEQFKQILSTLEKIISNVLENVGNEKYYKIKSVNI